MEITTVGPWILLGMGMLLLGIGTLPLAHTAIRVAGVKEGNLICIILLIFGVLCAGLGIYGPSFMGQYAEFLRAMSPMVKTPDTKSYQVVFDRIGKGDFDSEFQEIALSYALDRPLKTWIAC